MFRHPAWAVGSCSSGPPPAVTVRTQSTGGFYRPDWSPCTDQIFSFEACNVKFHSERHWPSLGRPIDVFEINERQQLRVASLGIPVVLRLARALSPSLLPNDHLSPARARPATTAPRGLRHAAAAMVVTDLGRMSRAR